MQNDLSRDSARRVRHCFGGVYDRSQSGCHRRRRMRQLAISLLCLIAVTGCNSDPGDPDPIPEPSSSRELVIEQKTLAGDTALTAVGLRPDGSEKADSRWGYQCDYSRPISLEEAWKQRFRVTIQNVSREVLEFEVVITQSSADGESPPRKRDLGRLVIPPLTEKRFSGFMLSPYKPGDKVCEVVLVDPADR